MSKNIGEKIKIRRNELGWTLRELADRMGYANHSTVARIESGKVDIPQSKVVKFAEVMGTTVAFLMDWEKVQKNNDVMADIIIRMRTDEDFLSVVESLYKLDSEKIVGVKQMLSAFLK
ncbi:MAG: helix-turn-helix transcriptional regulator [Ruminococcaceae bacterium]|nr:helix-turn-helix transcriptional regulator [Oscillospiraceae bacterium]